MEKIKEKPALGERVKEKAVSAPKELLRKVLDDGSERLRTQLRDTAQQGRRDEYGGDAIEDTAASGLHRAEKELLKQRKKKTRSRARHPRVTPLPPAPTATCRLSSAPERLTRRGQERPHRQCGSRHGRRL